MPKDKLPRAETPAEETDFHVPLAIGKPLALWGDDGVELLDEDTNTNIPGCFASVKCGKCSTKFLADLLSPELKQCPECSTSYTHVLLFCPVDNTDILSEALLDIADANGISEQELQERLGGLEDDGEQDDDNEDDDDDDDSEESSDDAGDDNDKA